MNSARNESFNDLRLSKEINIYFVPDDLPPEKISEFKVEFEKWIVSNGLRELIEGFSVFLDRLYECSLLVSQIGKPIDFSTHGGRIREIKKKGLPGKQKSLREEFGISSDLSIHFKTLYEARNCLSHERGVVTDEFCNTHDSLEVTWKTFEVWFVSNDGKERLVELKEGMEPIPGPGQLVNKTVERKRCFRLGESVTFSARDLAEICVFSYLGCDTIYFAALEFAKAKGAKIIDSEVEQTDASNPPSAALSEDGDP